MLHIAIEQDESSIHDPGDNSFLPLEIEKLFEIAQTGATGAVNSLGGFLRLNAPQIHLNCLTFLPLPILIDRIKMFYRDHLAFHLRFSGEISGEIYALFREQDAITLIQQVTGNKRIKSVKNMSRIEISAISELVNILSNSFWRALTEKALLNWWITPPVSVNDLSRILTYSSKVFTLDHLLINFEYLIPILDLRIQLIIMPAKSAIKRILSKLSQPAAGEAVNS
ncbi:MAG: hypothetical protein K6U80_03240 [Firmicutes bacterium]|nr:hypothetical protein [Bacillota bacterium]